MNKPRQVLLIQLPMVQPRVCILILLFVFSNANAIGQGSYLTVRFQPYWLDKPINVNQQFSAGKGLDSLRFSTLRFYISGLTSMNDSQTQLNDPDKAHLIDVFDTSRNHVAIDALSSDGATKFCFTLGLDSVLNTSGILDGDLDPVEGMYWTWQSGFIHFKLEGDFSVRDTEARRFEYHIGGYRLPYTTSRKVCLQSDRTRKDWNIVLALDQFLDPALVLEKPRLMSPGPDAVRLIERAASLFEVIDEP